MAYLESLISLISLILVIQSCVLYYETPVTETARRTIVSAAFKPEERPYQTSLRIRKKNRNNGNKPIGVFLWNK